MKTAHIAYAALTLAAGLVAATFLTEPAQAGNEVYTTGLRCNNKVDTAREFEKDRYVYFDTDSSRIRPLDLDKIQRIYSIAKGHDAQQICLFGKASKVGGAAGNVALGRKRAEKVAQEFEALGWPRSRIVIGSEGEAWGWLQDMLTSDAEADRRVLIRLSL